MHLKKQFKKKIVQYFRFNFDCKDKNKIVKTIKKKMLTQKFKKVTGLET